LVIKHVVCRAPNCFPGVKSNSGCIACRDFFPHLSSMSWGALPILSLGSSALAHPPWPRGPVTIELFPTAMERQLEFSKRDGRFELTRDPAKEIRN
jgi:hypothetical protein